MRNEETCPSLASDLDVQENQGILKLRFQVVVNSHVGAGIEPGSSARAVRAEPALQPQSDTLR